MITFRLATSGDDGELRRLLRSTELPGWVDLTIEREPSFVTGSRWFGHEWAVLAHDGSAIVGMYTAAVRPTHVNGCANRVGYLGGLRVCPGARHRIRLLRGGYASVPALAPVQCDVPWWLSVIAEKNTIALRLLERGVPGLPRYQRLGGMVTLVLPTRRGRRLNLWRRARSEDAEAIVKFFNHHAARYQCSPVLDLATVAGLGAERFLIHEDGNTLLGVVALWDQRRFRQVVVRGYRRPLRELRRGYNAYARLCRRMPLPRPGEALAQTFLAFLALAEATRPRQEALLADMLSHCDTPAATVGFHARHPLLERIDPFAPLRYPANVYAVTFDDRVQLDARAVQPESALL